MTPQEKAKELISTNSLTILSVVGNKLTMDEVKEIAKGCTLIVVDECIRVLGERDIMSLYWLHIKEELEKL